MKHIPSESSALVKATVSALCWKSTPLLQTRRSLQAAPEHVPGDFFVRSGNTLIISRDFKFSTKRAHPINVEGDQDF